MRYKNIVVLYSPAMYSNTAITSVTATPHRSAYDKGCNLSGPLFSYCKFINFPIDNV